MSEVKIRDVAEAAGISISSVSRILRGGQGHVYPTETHERVREVARRLGYQANTAARLLSQNTRTLIGMSVHFTEHPYLNRFLVAVHEQMLQCGYDPVFMDSQHLAGDKAVQPFPPPHMLAGLISLGVDLQTGWPPHYASLHERVPVVAVQPVSAEAAAHIDVIRTDFTSAYLQAIEHLTNLGHRHIAYLGVQKHTNPADNCKNKGWGIAAKKLGICADYRIHWSAAEVPRPEKASLVGNPNDFIYHHNSSRAMMDVMDQLKAFPNRITALICGSDEVAIALQSYLLGEGRQLPQQLSIIGYDGISLGEYVYPSLTTIAPDYTLMAKAAVDRLLYLIANRSETADTKPTEVLIQPQLIVRASTTHPASD